MRRLAADLPGHFLTPIRKFRFAGCASTQIETTGAALKEPLCTPGGPALIEGGTEVLVEVRVLNTATSESMADTRTLWRNGGTFVVKGVKTLDQDMSAALGAPLMPNLSGK